MIVLVLMGLGVIALINIFTVAYRSFSKTEERYVKQEEVKSVVELFQSSVSIGSATNAEIYNDFDVVPKGTQVDNTYTYIFVNQDSSSSSYGQLCVRYAGANTNVPILSDNSMYIYFQAYKAKDDPTNASAVDVNQQAVIVHIAALEPEAYNTDGTIKGAVKTNGFVTNTEYIYYGLDVTVHFPNMYYAPMDTRVNQVGTAIGYTYKYNATALTTNKVDSADNGIVFRYITELSTLLTGAGGDVELNTFCFIATASYGVESPDVGLLCSFRDNVLLKTEAGEWFVQEYYKYSPDAAKVIRNNDTLKLTTRILLKPLVAVAYVALNPEWLVLIVPLAGGLLVTFVRRRQKIIITD